MLKNPPDEKQLLTKAKNGNEIARNRLLEIHNEQITIIAASFSSTNKGIDFDDFKSEAMIAFDRAVSRYEEKVDVQFKTYYSKVIKNALINYANIQNKYFIRDFEDDDKSWDDHSDEKKKENIRTDEDTLNEIGDKDEVQQYMKYLSDIEKQVCNLSLTEGKSVIEAATELNISFDKAKKVKKEAMTKIKYKSLFGDLYDL